MPENAVAEDAEMDNIGVVDFHPVAAADDLHNRDVYGNTYFRYTNCMTFKLNEPHFYPRFSHHLYQYNISSSNTIFNPLKVEVSSSL